MQLIDYLITALEKVIGVVLILLSTFAATFTSHAVVTPPLAPAVIQEASATTDSFPVASTTKKTASTPAAQDKNAPLKPIPQKSSNSVLEPAADSAGQTLTQQVSSPTDIDVNALARGSLVNILCITQASGYLHPISGSGVVVDSRGIILTNAHVGQYFLLKDYGVKNNVQCVVRIGSPAQTRYTAELLYLPPAWVSTNAPKILLNEPTGTGENDYAFLRITGTTNPSGILPPSFAALAMDASSQDTGTRTLLASYPAGLIDGLTIETNLYQSSAFTLIGALYSFDGGNQVDVFSIGGTIISQAGSSGGAVVDASSGKLLGIITTASASTTTAGRDLNAISIGHINRSLVAAGEGGVVELLSGNLAAKASAFNSNVAPTLTAQLSAELKKTLP